MRRCAPGVGHSALRVLGWDALSTWFSFLLPSEKSSSTIASKSFDIMSNVSFCCSAVVYLRVAA